MAKLPGRIRRISLDAGDPVNYTLKSTSTYDDGAPATGSAAMSTDDVETLDQEVSIAVPPALTVSQLGTLVTFERFPKFFTGVTVKIRPTYDSDAGEDPYLELWTHDSVALEWTQRSAKQLRSGFVGCPSGKVKYYGGNDIDGFFLAVQRENVDKVWITMNPGGTGTPSLEFVALHVFGKCVNEPVLDASCEADPNVDCLPPVCENLDDCLTPQASCDDLVADGTLEPGSCVTPPYDGPGLPPGGPGGVGPDPGPRRYDPPDFPVVDLCDPVALQAFKDSMTPEQLEYFTELLSNVELPCLDEDTHQPNEVSPINPGPLLPKQPTETYYSPVTLAPAADPRGAPDPVPDPTGPFTTVGYFMTADGGDAGTSNPGCETATAHQRVIDDFDAGGFTGPGATLANQCYTQTFPLNNDVLGSVIYSGTPPDCLANGSPIFTRVRITFDSALSDADVRIQMVDGNLGSANFTKFAVDNGFFSMGFLGIGPPDTVTDGDAQWEHVDTLGPIDIELSNWGDLPTPLYIAIKVTITTNDEPVSGLTMEVQ